MFPDYSSLPLPVKENTLCWSAILPWSVHAKPDALRRILHILQRRSVAACSLIFPIRPNYRRTAISIFPWTVSSLLTISALTGAPCPKNWLRWNRTDCWITIKQFCPEKCVSSLRIQNLFNAFIMKKFVFCRKSFDLLQSCKHISICFFCLRLQIFVIDIHDEAIHPQNNYLSLTRILHVYK